MPQPNTNVSRILATTAQRYLPELPDAIFNGLRAMKIFRDKGCFEGLDGGEQIYAPLQYSKNTTARWMNEYDQLDINQQDTITAAQFGWKMLAGDAIVTDLEAAKNGDSKTRVINLVKAKIDNLVMSLQDQFNSALFSDGLDTSKPIGLEAIVLTTGTYGNIARSGNTWWQGNVTAVGGALTETAMRNIFNDASRNIYSPDLVVTTKEQYAKYESLCYSVVRNLKFDEGQVGFDHLMFKGAPVIWDHYCPSGVMYFLNTKFFKVYYHEKNQFTMGDPQRHPYQLLTIHPCTWFGAICCRLPNTQGKLTGLT